MTGKRPPGAVCPLSFVQQAAAEMADCSLTVVPDAGHGINVTHVEPFVRDLLPRDR